MYKILLTILVLLLTTSSANSEIYKWKDDNGHWCFSDIPTNNAKKVVLHKVNIVPAHSNHRVKTNTAYESTYNVNQKRVHQEHRDAKRALRESKRNHRKALKLIKKSATCKSVAERKSLMAQAEMLSGFKRQAGEHNSRTNDNYNSSLVSPPAANIINGEWDNMGNHYQSAGAGNQWRSDGTFMQKAAGGFIDTKTGRFIPAN